jgi:hypothetical protein
MRRWNSSAKVLVGGLLLVAACGKGGESGGAAAGGGAAAVTAFPVDTANAATVTGRVAFTGAKPVMARIDMSEETTCAGKHPGGAFVEQVVVNDNGTLRNVFVYVKSGVPANLQFPVPATPVEIDQNGCQYQPHVFGIQVAQTLNIKNEDGLLHNIKALPTANRPFNISQPSNMTTPRSFSTAEVMVPLQCNVHSWMNAFVGVRSDPYYAVTGADGTFRIGRLPPGTYTIEAWQEKYGTQTQTVTVAAKESKAITFTFHS